MQSQQACEEMLVNLRRIIRASDVHSRFLLAEYKLTAPQFVVLKVIISAGQITLGELAARVSLSNATLTGIITRLKKSGLVRRNRSKKDQRVVFVTPTKAALESKVLQDAPPLLQERLAVELGKLEEWKRDEILSSFKKVASIMDPRDDDPPPEQSEDGPKPSGDASDDWPEPPPERMDDTFPSREPRRSRASVGETSPQKKPRIHVLRRPSDYPFWVDREKLAAFLRENFSPKRHELSEIRNAIDDALSRPDGSGGFILVAEIAQQMVGALVMLRTGVGSYLPPYLLLFMAIAGWLAVPDIGGPLLERATSLCKGGILFNLEHDDRAWAIYGEFGFKTRPGELLFHE